jgi:AcrR family transcriptional regulator
VARPARYTSDDLLDAAVTLLVAEGPAAVAMVAVARAVGAPSGSVYHRFPTRAALCGALWLRTEERFQAGFVAALESGGDDVRRCVAAARYVVAWCREHPGEAQVLLQGPGAFDPEDWPDAIRERRGELGRRLAEALAGLAVDPDRLRAAVIDVPYGVVRRHLVARQTIPESVDEIVEDCAHALISMR